MSAAEKLLTASAAVDAGEVPCALKTGKNAAVAAGQDSPIPGVRSATAAVGTTCGWAHEDPALRNVTEGAISFRLEREGTKPMEVHFTPEQEARIAQVAAIAGTDPQALVKDATMRLLNEDAGFAVAAKGKTYGGRGEEEKMNAAVNRILELQKHVKPDPEGWTIKDYINYGRP